MVSTPSKTLNTESLAQQLNELAARHGVKTWCLAYSGGVDSEVLLHLLQSSSLDVYAVYIDHGLQAESVQWEKHCEEQCAAYGVHFQCIAVNAHSGKGESPEAAARSARYTALGKIIDEHTCLLTAQHQQDQVETVLLQLFRGAGAAGLSAMPFLQRFAEGWHCRPLLDISQQAILDYASLHKLRWVEDPSNQQQRYDRNYLRHSVVPRLQQRWPALATTLSQFATQQAENHHLLEQLASIDLADIQQADKTLSIPALLNFDVDRRRNVLRFWLKQQGAMMPSRAILQQIIQQAESTGYDNQSLVGWARSEVRRFRDRLYYLSQSPHDPAQCISLIGSELLAGVDIHSLGLRVKLEESSSSASRPYMLDRKILEQPLSLRFRQGGERIQPAGRSGHRELKKLFQEAGVPGWQRARIPLLYSGDELVAVIGYWLAQEYAVEGEGLSIETMQI